MREVVKRFLRDESGTTAIEYGLIGLLVGVGCIAAFTTLGGNLATLFGTSEGGISAAMHNAMTTANAAPGNGQ
ncbi:MAG: Flp family type IVb pilin [Devosia sp.]